MTCFIGILPLLTNVK